jgi:hypothetical protein
MADGPGPTDEAVPAGAADGAGVDSASTRPSLPPVVKKGKRAADMPANVPSIMRESRFAM